MPRHPGTDHLLNLFEYDHLPDHLADISRPLAKAAYWLASALEDGPELTTGLRKLLEAKDCFVRQRVIDHRAGVDPPGLAWGEGVAEVTAVIGDDPDAPIHGTD